MLSLNQISVFLGGKTLFENISFNIDKKNTIGLVGKNGAGKSTLLKIISGKQSPSEGTVSFPKNYRIAHLTQDIVKLKGKILLEEINSAFSELNALESEISKLENFIQTHSPETEEYLTALDKLNQKTLELEQLGLQKKDKLIEQTLLGLGFKKSDFHKNCEHFSGGWQMRIELAKILLSQPDLILLDEPSNHLDISSIFWLEKFMKSYAGSIILVSHDRKFLDNTTNRTIEISNKKIYDYPTNYSKYVNLREERLAQQLSEYENQQKFIEQTKKFIERFRYKASKAKQAQSKIKMLEKLERIEIDNIEKASIHFDFPPAPRSGRHVVEIEDLHKSFGNNHVLKGIDFMLERGEKIALVGDNGQGKSTFAKLILKELSDFSGKIELGHNVNIGYYAQNQADTLDSQLTVYETIANVAPAEMQAKVRNLIGAFLFSGDDQEKTVKVLSGGEKSRLALCRLLLFPYNLLVLDEPTNHLDLRSKEILKNALKNFDGSLMIISHDRDFLDGLVEKVIEFKDGEIKTYLGGIYDYISKTMEAENVSAQAEIKTENSVETIEIKLDYEEQKKLKRGKQKVQRQIENCEAKIEKLEEKIEEIEVEMAKENFYEDRDFAQKQLDIYKQSKSDLDIQMQLWEELTENLEKFG